jgi:hypothetical protein
VQALADSLEMESPGIQTVAVSYFDRYMRDDQSAYRPQDPSEKINRVIECDNRT